MFVIASASLSAVKYVNSFARCQHLFDIPTKHRLTSIRIFCRTLLPCLSYILRLKCYHLICRWQTVAVITSRKFHRNMFSILAKRKKYRIHGTPRHTSGQKGDGTDKAKRYCLRCGSIKSIMASRNLSRIFKENSAERSSHISCQLSRLHFFLYWTDIDSHRTLYCTNVIVSTVNYIRKTYSLKIFGDR